MGPAPAWQPWLAPTRLDQLERCQNRALRIITGQLKTTPLEARSDPAAPTTLHQSHLRGAAFTPSFAEEAAAMQVAMEWATTNHTEYSLTICTDSQSLLQ